MGKKIFLSAIIFFSGLSLTQAQLPYFHSVEIDKTISGIKVQVMMQDHKKILWLGTSKGLYRFDGNSFKLVDPEKKINDAIIPTALFCDDEGKIWVGLKSGNILNYEGDSLRLFNSGKGMPKEKISGIIEDNKNRIWFATYGEGVYIWDGTSMKNINSENGMPDENIYSITCNGTDKIWVGTDAGITQFDESSGKIILKNYFTTDGLNDNIITQLIWDEKRNRLWYGTQDHGIGAVCFDSLHVEVPVFSNQWSSGSVESMLLLERTLWVGTSVGGLISYEPGRSKRVQSFLGTDEFKYSSIQSLFLDDEGNIWIACKDKLLQSPGEKIEFKKTINGKSVENIHAAFVDQGSRLWYSDDNGLHRITFNADGTETEKKYSFVEQRITFKILSIFQDAFGYIWIGTFDHGTYRLDPESGNSIHIDDNNGLANQSVLSVSGKLSSVWLATLEGAIRIDLGDDALKLKCGMSFNYYKSSDGLQNNFIYQVMIDRYNNVWFAQDGNSITMLDQDGFHQFNEKNGLTGKSYFAITQDINGGLWLASTDQGLFRLKNSKDKNFIHYDLQNGLPSIHLSSLCADKAGNVVVVCQEGVAVFNLDADQFNWYQSNEGITSVDADLNTTSLAPDGSVWIGGKNEFIMMNTSLGKYRITPFLMLDGAKAMLEPFDISTYQNIQASKNHVSFSFNGIWFSNPSEVSFQYKLEGWNRDWVSTKDHSVNFANLDAGRYTFRLRCSRTGDFSRSKELNYQFAILNPLYLQWWFVLIVLGVLIILIWLFLRFRDRRMNILQKLEKEKIASQLETLKNQVNPHFLFNSFNTLANIIDEDKDKAVDYIERMTDFFRQILIHREKDLITLHEEMEIINDYVYLQKQRFNGALQTQISISESDAESHLIPPLVVQLLVENSIKHNALTSQKPLLIEIFFDGENFTVRNNLNPKLTREPSTGTGLQNISRRMEMLGLDEPEIIKNENYFIVKLKLPIKA